MVLESNGHGVREESHTRSQLGGSEPEGKHGVRIG
jgi:hypothetical protein